MPTTGHFPPAPPTVILVRHAESEHHLNGMTGGWTDTDLSPRGRLQADRLAARLGIELAGVPLTLLASDLRRAWQTAAPLGPALGITPVAEPGLREINNGEATGLTVVEAAARFPESVDRLWQMDDRIYPGAETWREFRDRLAAVLAALPPDGPLPVLVTHGGAIMTLVAVWLGITDSFIERLWFGAPPSSITVLKGDRWGMRGLERLGDAGHLYGDGPWTLQPLVTSS